MKKISKDKQSARNRWRHHKRIYVIRIVRIIFGSRLFRTAHSLDICLAYSTEEYSFTKGDDKDNEYK